MHASHSIGHSFDYRLNQIIPRLTSDELLNNSGLGNEIGFYIFAYPPEEELEVRKLRATGQRRNKRIAVALQDGHQAEHHHMKNTLTILLLISFQGLCRASIGTAVTATTKIALHRGSTRELQIGENGPQPHP